MPNLPKTYVRTDEHGVMRVGQDRVLMDGVVYAFLEGDSAESIMQQYPALALEEVYGAIAYYLANREEVDQYLKRQEKIWEELKRESDKRNAPLLERLRRIRRERASKSA